jgi:hypothetical protein
VIGFPRQRHASHTLCAESTAVLKHALRCKSTQPVLFTRPPPKPRPALQKTQPPARRPHQVPRAKTPCGPKSNSGATPWGAWRAPKVVLLGYACPIPSPTPQWVTAKPRRPPRGGPAPSRSKMSAPWGVQSRLYRQSSPCSQWATQVGFRWQSSLDSKVDHGCWR